MNTRYRVTLTAEERSHVTALIQKGKVAERRVKRAQILLAADQGATDETIAKTVAVGTSRSTGPSSALSRKAPSVPSANGSQWRPSEARRRG